MQILLHDSKRYTVLPHTEQILPIFFRFSVPCTARHGSHSGNVTGTDNPVLFIHKIHSGIVCDEIVVIAFEFIHGQRDQHHPVDFLAFMIIQCSGYNDHIRIPPGSGIGAVGISIMQHFRLTDCQQYRSAVPNFLICCGNRLCSGQIMFPANPHDQNIQAFQIRCLTLLQIFFHLINVLEGPDIVKLISFRQIQPKSPAGINGIGNILQIFVKRIPLFLHLKKYLFLGSAISIGKYILGHSQYHTAHHNGNQKNSQQYHSQNSYGETVPPLFFLIFSYAFRLHTDGVSPVTFLNTRQK